MKTLRQFLDEAELKRQYWASYRKHQVGPHDSREEAAAKLFAKHPNVKTATTGHGAAGPHFDIQFIDKTKK